ncbi:MAG: hypothetical protein J5I50_13790 [Chitinophagaceae bacterium]|nr:hypothetical protein [Chitinophagaceae bacterium]
MKQIFLGCIALLTVTMAFSQSGRYITAMKKNIAMLDSVMIKNNFEEIANNFTRIGDAEKDKWLPYYYAAYVMALKATVEKDASKKDALADQATASLKKSEEILKQDNSEIEVIKSMIATAHMTVDPQSRYMMYGQIISESLKKAETLDSTNPRPVLIQAQNLFYTPEAFGGGKDAAKPLFDKAADLFAKFKPASDIAPQWGKDDLDYFMNMYRGS